MQQTFIVACVALSSTIVAIPCSESATRLHQTGGQELRRSYGSIFSWQQGQCGEGIGNDGGWIVVQVAALDVGDDGWWWASFFLDQFLILPTFWFWLCPFVAGSIWNSNTRLSFKLFSHIATAICQRNALWLLFPFWHEIHCIPGVSWPHNRIHHLKETEMPPTIVCTRDMTW